MKFSTWLEARKMVVTPKLASKARFFRNTHEETSKQLKRNMDSWNDLARKERHKNMTPEEIEREKMLVKKRVASKKNS